MNLYYIIKTLFVTVILLTHYFTYLFNIKPILYQIRLKSNTVSYPTMINSVSTRTITNNSGDVTTSATAIASQTDQTHRKTLFSFRCSKPYENSLVTTKYQCDKSLNNYSYLEHSEFLHFSSEVTEPYNEANTTPTDRENLLHLSNEFKINNATYRQALDFFNPNVSPDIVYPIYYSSIKHLLTRSKTLKVQKPPQWFIDSSFWGVHPKTELVDADGESRTIQTIGVGERLCHGEVVIGKVCFLPPKEMYMYRDMICTGSLVVKDQGTWKSIGFPHEQSNDEIYRIDKEDWDELDEGYPEYMCNLITTTQQFTSAGIPIRDFSLVRDDTLFRHAAHNL